jgi:hypothetical protein
MHVPMGRERRLRMLALDKLLGPHACSPSTPVDGEDAPV